MSDIATDFSSAREDIFNLAVDVPATGPDHAERCRQAIARAERYIEAARIWAKHPNWSNEKIKEDRERLIDGLVSDRRNSEIADARVIQAAINRLIEP